jgi:hypothetical protein
VDYYLDWDFADYAPILIICWGNDINKINIEKETKEI